MNSSTCSLLVHTFNKYEHFWDGFLKGWRENYFWGDTLPHYFGTDEQNHGSHDFQNFKLLYSGTGEWSDRLTNLLHQIPTEYVWYIQEDMWPTERIPGTMLSMMKENGILRLQLSPIVQFYSLFGDKLPLFFHQKSKYLVSHQPSIWLKSFLLECLKPNENPWDNEYRGTQRLNERPEIAGKIAIYPCNWFKHVGFKGQIIQ